MAFHDDRVRRWWPSPLRLFLGIAFIYHGAPKLFTAAGHQGFAANLQRMGTPAPGALAWLLGLLEFFGGIALILGVAVTLVTALLTIEMLVALFKVHLPHGFNFVQVTGMSPSGPVFGLPGGEVNLLYIAALLALLIGGPGPLSFEAWNRRRRRSRAAGLPAAEPQHA